MARAIAYVRVSTLEQAHEGISLEAQERRIRAWCDVQEITLEDIYVDPGVGGQLQAHPEEHRLVTRAAELRSTGMGLRKVARVLLEEGFVPATGTKFHPEQTRRWTRSM